LLIAARKHELRDSAVLLGRLAEAAHLAVLTAVRPPHRWLTHRCDGIRLPNCGDTGNSARLQCAAELRAYGFPTIRIRIH
jgi:hypothetical protein